MGDKILLKMLLAKLGSVVCLGGFLASKRQWEARAGMEVTRIASHGVRTGKPHRAQPVNCIY